MKFLLILSLPLLMSAKIERFERDVELEKESFYDPEFDYSRFSGRITDRDVSGNIVKIQSENKNTRFFKAGDLVNFAIATVEKEECQAFVRSVEMDYFVVYIKDLSPCFGKQEYLRRGTTLVFHAPVLFMRVKEAGQYRLRLMKRKDDFFVQLNKLNQFLYSYRQEEVKLLAEYEKKLLDLEKEKRNAISLLRVKWQDSTRLQRELMYQLEKLKHDLEYYRIDKFEPYADRWHLDHNLGLPVGARPQDVKEAKSESN